MPMFRTKAMKRMAAVLLCGAALTAAAAAQDTPPPPPPQGDMQGPPPGGPGGGRGPGNPARRLEMLKTRLNLSDDQVAKIKAIQEEGRGKMEAVRNDASLDGKARREKSMALRLDENVKVRGVLNDDQKKKYDEMEAQMRERARERRDGGGPGGPPPAGSGGDNPPPAPPPSL